MQCFVVPGRRMRSFYTLTLREPSRTRVLGFRDRWETIREIMLTRQQKAA